MNRFTLMFGAISMIIIGAIPPIEPKLSFVAVGLGLWWMGFAVNDNGK